MKIVGITKIRNEEHIIKETLDHFAQYCNKGIYIYDDCSDDKTVAICEQHFATRGIIQNKTFNDNRYEAEHEARQAVLTLAKKSNPDWIVCFDADERLDVDWKGLEYIMKSPDADAIFMKLFDAYITKDDLIDEIVSFDASEMAANGEATILDHCIEYGLLKEYSERKWFGPEYRNIGMFFRNTPFLKYHKPDQRIASFIGKAVFFGYVKHYGKAISIEKWEEKCNYYSNWEEPYRSKWIARKGKAIHEKSDFGNALISWEEKEEKGVFLY